MNKNTHKIWRLAQYFWLALNISAEVLIIKWSGIALSRMIAAEWGFRWNERRCSQTAASFKNREETFDIFRLDLCTIERVVRSHLLILNFPTIKSSGEMKFELLPADACLQDFD